MGPGDVIPVMGMLTGIFTIGLMAWGFVAVSRGPVGQALARRIQGRHGAAEADVLLAVDALREQVDALQQQLLETQERLDFTERLLSSGRARQEQDRS